MRRKAALVVLVLLVGVSWTCSNSTGPTIVPDFFVDAVHGNDANAGTSDAPFKTITKALSVAAAGNTIKVRPGRYDEVNGEHFPLRGPAGVILIGDEADKGGGSTPTKVVSKASSPLFAPPADAVIAGFTITDSASGTAAVLGDYDSLTLRNSRVINSYDIGVRVMGTGYAITQNVFGNLPFALIVSASGRIEANVITNNGEGVVVANSSTDLGGGAAGSAGGNILSCNAAIDLEAAGGFTVTAADNQWDHIPPTTDTSRSYPRGVDIYKHNDSTTVLTSGATLASGACP